MSTHAYPLAENAANEVQTASGKPIDSITLDALEAGQLDAADVQINAATLRAQAEVARAAGYVQLAENLTRAAELTAVPNAEILQMYEALRPGRSTHEELIALAQRLEHVYEATQSAQLVREAAQTYQARGLFKAQNR